MAQQINYAYTNRAGEKASGAYWCSRPGGLVVLAVRGAFVYPRRTRVTDRHKGIETQWMEIR